MQYLTETFRFKILVLLGFGDKRQIQVEVVELFRGTFPDLPSLSHKTISKIQRQFRDIGYVKPLPRRIANYSKIDIFLSIEENLTVSSHQIARDHNSSYTTVLRCCKRRIADLTGCNIFRN